MNKITIKDKKQILKALHNGLINKDEAITLLSVSWSWSNRIKRQTIIGDKVTEKYNDPDIFELCQRAGLETFQITREVIQG
jgi:hypothetical protein